MRSVDSSSAPPRRNEPSVGSRATRSTRDSAERSSGIGGSSALTARTDELRAEISRLVAEYYAGAFAHKSFVPGETAIPASTKVFDERELINLVDSALDFWLTSGRFAARFEQDFARLMGVRHAL